MQAVPLPADPPVAGVLPAGPQVRPGCAAHQIRTDGAAGAVPVECTQGVPQIKQEFTSASYPLFIG